MPVISTATASSVVAFRGFICDFHPALAPGLLLRRLSMRIR